VKRSRSILEEYKLLNSKSRTEATFSALKSHMPQIIGLQLVCAFLENFFGAGSCASGISMQISNTYAVLKLLSNCSISALLMEIFLEDDHMLKCKWGMQCLTLRTSAVCILNTVDQFQLKVAKSLHQLSNCCSWSACAGKLDD
jgi:hypothetical protein